MAESVFYAISETLAELTAMSESNLSIEPFPTEFVEGQEAGISGDGNPIELGFSKAVWRYDVPLTASEFNELMTFVGDNAYAAVFIRTRKNTINITDGEYNYGDYSCIMHRPVGKSRPPFRMEDVEVSFSRLLEQ